MGRLSLSPSKWQFYGTNMTAEFPLIWYKVTQECLGVATSVGIMQEDCLLEWRELNWWCGTHTAAWEGSWCTHFFIMCPGGWESGSWLEAEWCKEACQWWSEQKLLQHSSALSTLSLPSLSTLGFAFMIMHHKLEMPHAISSCNRVDAVWKWEGHGKFLLL